jgi:methionyl-tRNA formyltransferase
MHGGWLPDYRGSTPCYYSYLQDNTFGVTAILLDEHIDSGPIVARQRYPVPPPETDIDYYYDSAIRADLLISTVKRWRAEGQFEELIEQKTHEGTTHYVIHPVLKHVALNSICGRAARRISIQRCSTMRGALHEGHDAPSK